LIRGAVRDDAAQAHAAGELLKKATLIAVPLPSLCEFAWVLRRVYGFSPANIAVSIHALLAASNVATNRPAVEAGLRMLEAGGDFADGVIAYEGRWLGAELFCSFDKRAVKMLTAAGEKAELLA
jgi:predicted nucleic-acid-binding protein